MVAQSQVPGSPMHMVGTGVAAENRLPSQNNRLMVTPLSLTPLMQGELAQQTQATDGSITDLQGNVIKSQLKSDSAWALEWYPPDSRIIDAPYIRRGEPVEIWRYADTKQYFWREFSMNTQLRRGERYRIGVSASSAEDQQGGGIYDNNYVLDINGPGGMFAITTSSSNGEAANYSISIDGTNGHMYFGDHVGNFFTLDTKNYVLYMTNSYGTSIEINLENMTLMGNDTITTQFLHLIDTIGKSIKQQAGETIDIEAGETITIKAGQKIRLEAPDIELAGRIKFYGPITQADGGSGYGTDCAFIGNTTWQGNMNANGTWTINGVIVDKHKHNTPDGMSDVPTKG